jgi:DNA-binding CsgD family transcriptional regulator
MPRIVHLARFSDASCGVLRPYQYQAISGEDPGCVFLGTVKSCDGVTRANGADSQMTQNREEVIGDQDALENTWAGSGESITVPIQCLAEADSPRLNGEDTQHIRLLAESAAPLPPILVHRSTMRVIDGMHRLRVALLKGQSAIEVRFFNGTEDEAFIAAVKANTSHGLPLTLADREAAAARIISSHPQHSNRWIATATGLAPATVGAVRRKLPQNGHPVTARIGRDGRIRPLSSADGRQLARDEIARHPDASLREIARVAGISPATVRDVRERLRRGDSPIPAPRNSRQPRQVPPGTSANPDDEQIDPFSISDRRRVELLQDLRKDPSLRHTESGRALIRWLDVRACGPGKWEEFISEVSPHAFYKVVEVAKCCAEEWLQVAARLEDRLKTMELIIPRPRW